MSNSNRDFRAEAINLNPRSNKAKATSMGGFTLLFRSLLDKGWASNPEYLATWVRLILKASHSDHELFVNGKTLKLSKGQFFTGRKALAKEVGMSESKLERVLGFFKREGMITWESMTKGRVITIENYGRFQANFADDTPTHTPTHTPQKTEQPQTAEIKAFTGIREQQPNSNRTATEHKQTIKQLNKDQEIKKEKGARQSRIPEDFCITEKMRAWSDSKNFIINIDDETENFIFYWKGEGKTKADWVATWQGWMRRNNDNALKSGGRGRTSNANNGRKTFADQRTERNMQVLNDFVIGDDL